ncbi:hypothetical protein ACHAWU_003211 [Discostella pseudostelligera]|uniref:Uncharacterized protein n=1 Tax=Discostella pseudostelligera TaxID=259834 RepID=A0ABD3N8M1_9STRA
MKSTTSSSKTKWTALGSDDDQLLPWLDDWEVCTSSSQCINGCCSSSTGVVGDVLICNPLSGGYTSDICVGLADASSTRSAHQAEKRITALRGSSSQRRNLAIPVASSTLTDFFRELGASSLSTGEKIVLAIGMIGLVAALTWWFQHRVKSTAASSE